MIPDRWRDGEVVVIGLGRSGQAATRWLRKHEVAVYASDVADTPSVHETARALTELGATVTIGGHDLDRVRNAAVVVVSPGVPPSAEALRAAREAGIDILSELDLGLQALDGVSYVAVTGTNGKTTTTALITHVLMAAGVRAVAAGNIGTPLSAVALEDETPEWLVVEASSFQLHDAPHMNPTIGVLTNLDADHLDRYAAVDEYFDDKRLLFRGAHEESIWILNRDDAAVMTMAGDVQGTHCLWSLQDQADAWFDRHENRLMLGDDVLVERTAFPLLGDHNVGNALAAALATLAAGVDVAAIGRALTTVAALPHRLEPIGESRGVLWINDSKATNVPSTIVALRAMTQPYVLLLGGLGKGQSFDSLRAHLDLCKDVVVLGKDGPTIAGALEGAVAVHRVPEFDDAVSHGAKLAQAGDAMLLSPACASFDQFDNYESRGNRFRALMETP